MTGRGAGYCAGYPVPGYANPGFGREMGRGMGRGGRGRRNWFYATGLPGWQRAGAGFPAWGAGPVGPVAAPAATPETELAALKNQAEFLEDSLKDVKERIEELGKSEK